MENKDPKKTVQVLKGNFTPRQPVEVNEAKEDLTTQFEREALKRLGGSIAFVSKKKFLFGMGKKDDKAGATSNEAEATGQNS